MKGIKTIEKSLMGSKQWGNGVLFFVVVVEDSEFYLYLSIEEKQEERTRWKI